jgi:hypothetical protein
LQRAGAETDRLEFAFADLTADDGWAAAANDVELTVINPVGIFGPVLGSDLAASIQIVSGLLDGRRRYSPRRRSPPSRASSPVELLGRRERLYSASWLTSPAKMPGSAAAAGTIADRTDACVLARNRPAVSTR